MENNFATNLVDAAWTGSEFDLLTGLLAGNPWGAPAAIRNADTGLWIPGFTFVFASHRMTWFALTTPKPYSLIRPWVLG